MTIGKNSFQSRTAEASARIKLETREPAYVTCSAVMELEPRARTISGAEFDRWAWPWAALGLYSIDGEDLTAAETVSLWLRNGYHWMDCLEYLKDCIEYLKVYCGIDNPREVPVA